MCLCPAAKVAPLLRRINHRAKVASKGLVLAMSRRNSGNATTQTLTCFFCVSSGKTHPRATMCVRLDQLLAPPLTTGRCAPQDLLLLSEIIGPVNPTRSTDHEVSTLASAPVFCECRRVDKRGRIKSKLSVVGIRCVECAICLLRMREHQMGTVFPGCLHVFHTKCIERWLTQSRFCPTCRAPIDGAASTGERTTP